MMPERTQRLSNGTRMDKRYVLALDQGTTSSRAIVFDRGGAWSRSPSASSRQIFPQPGWVEHDARDIWADAARRHLEAQSPADRRPRQIATDRHHQPARDHRVVGPATGQPMHHAIVWQDRRTAGRCDELRARGHANRVQQKTGLVIDAYFSGTKLAGCWTTSTWRTGPRGGGRTGLRHDRQLAGVEPHRRPQHATDYSNASRTHAVQPAHRRMGRGPAQAAAHPGRACCRGWSFQR
jgi:glycerol kinase